MKVLFDGSFYDIRLNYFKHFYDFEDDMPC